MFIDLKSDFKKFYFQKSKGMYLKYMYLMMPMSTNRCLCQQSVAYVNKALLEQKCHNKAHLNVFKHNIF